MSHFKMHGKRINRKNNTILIEYQCYQGFFFCDKPNDNNV